MSGDRASLENKDKGELQTIVEALGGKATARATKADLIQSVLDLSKAGDASADETSTSRNADSKPKPKPRQSQSARSGDGGKAKSANSSKQNEGNRQNGGNRQSGSAKSTNSDSEDKPTAKIYDDQADDDKPKGGNGDFNEKGNDRDRNERDRNDKERTEKREDDDGNRRRRRGRGRGRDREEDGVKADPEPVAGYLDLREEGYGFLRVDGYLPSKEDIYVSVKQVRTGSLRRGDYLTGTARPATRNEKNAALHSLETINGKSVEESADRPLFDNLTPVMPSEQLVLEHKGESNITGRVVDLLAPIGKGQRGLIVSPPQAGKTSTLVEMAKAIEANSPDTELIVLLVDERPEEVTEIRRQLQNADVMSSTFDRPPDEHTAVAELTIARAQRLVEEGQDVCVLLDGITRLARAYNQSAPHTGRSLGGGLDAGAIHPTKRLFGAARKLEEGGSLTIIATIAVETGAELDEMIYTEFSGTANMELRLNRELAAKRVYPAVDVVASRTTGEASMFSEAEMKGVSELRKALVTADEANGRGSGMTALATALAKSSNNADFLASATKGTAL